MAGERVEVVLVYQSLLGIYGDRGNATVLVKRLAWRGFDPVLTVVEPGDPLPDSGNVYLLGGGEDAAQISAVRALQADGGLHRAVERGAAVLAVCAGYQIVGNSFTVGDNDDVIEGLGLLDVTTTRGPVRAVGEILSRWQPAANGGGQVPLQSRLRATPGQLFLEENRWPQEQTTPLRAATTAIPGFHLLR